jgi:hypothetical protein
MTFKTHQDFNRDGCKADRNKAVRLRSQNNDLRDERSSRKQQQEDDDAAD